MRVTLVIHSLGSGGAERVMTTMANYWSARGWNVHLLTFDHGGEVPFYHLNPTVLHSSLNIAAVSLSISQAVATNMRRIRVLRAAIKKSDPEVVISFMSSANVTVILATLGLNVPVIVSERVDVSSHCLGTAWKLLRRWTYPRATRIVVQSKLGLEHLSSGLRGRCRIIPNPVVNPIEPTTSSSRTAVSPTVIAMGRLAEQKGFDLLLRAFAEVSPAFPNWSLEIWGVGPSRSSLEALASTLKIDSQVRFAGTTQDPHAEFRKAAFFVLSSRYEGFPNALCEAMACGLPVISFDCKSGPGEIIRQNIDGLLVANGDIDGLARAMARLMSNEGERKRLARRASEVVVRFGVEKIMKQWDKMIREILR